MAKRKRNYKQEYQRRIARGLKDGLSRSQARGHRKLAESPVSTKRFERMVEDAKLQFGLKAIRKGETLTAAAKSVGLSRERLRNYAVEKGAIEKRGRKWALKQTIARRVLIYSGGSEHKITIRDPNDASLLGRYMAAVRQFLQTNDAAVLKPFIGKSVRDVNRKSYRLETGPKTLYRLAHTATSSFEQVYRFVL